MTSGVASIETHEQVEAERPPLLREVFGRVLRQERTRQGRTLAEVERGRKEASSEVLGSICDALGGSLIEFVGGVHRELLGARTRPVALAAA